jgi:phospholipid/cholesterol/gamma-HCH transport system substrate-binding protein
VGEIAGSLSDVAKSLQESVGGNGTDKHILGRIVQNIERLTSDLSQMTSANRDKINDIVDEVHGITGTLNGLINDEGPDGFKAGWKKAVASLSRLDTSLKNIEEITGKVNRGEGTIGRLINDDSTVEELNGAIEGVSGLLDTANKTQTSVDFHADYLGNLGFTKSVVGLKIQPGLDRYYLVEVVDDPVGVVEETETKTTITGTTTSDTQATEVKTYKNQLKFSLEFAKNFFDWTIRGGVIENAGGVGIDYHAFRNKLRLSLEAFEFSKINVRSTAQYNFYKGIYVNTGVNDMFNRSSRFSGFVGAGIFLTNDDLKMLLTKSPF